MACLPETCRIKTNGSDTKVCLFTVLHHRVNTITRQVYEFFQELRLDVKISVVFNAKWLILKILKFLILQIKQALPEKFLRNEILRIPFDQRGL